MTIDEREAEKPPDKITVRGSIVVIMEEWILWGGEPHNSLLIRREKDGFFVKILSPGYGDIESSGKRDLEEVLSALRFSAKNIVKPIVKLFQMEGATKEEICKLFPYHKIALED